MPSSYVDSVPPIVKLLIEIAPARVVDIGPGWGKYGLLCREYLPNLQVLEAVEVVTGRKLTQDAIYDRVHVSDVCDLAGERFWRKFDMALMIDVIEHIAFQDAHQVLKWMLHGGCKVLVSTPKVFQDQDDPDNPYERHVTLWSWDALRGYEIARDVSTIDSLIYLLDGTR
jgi:hypothetical protein